MVDALTAERLAELRAAAKYDDARYPHHWATHIFPFVDRWEKLTGQTAKEHRVDFNAESQDAMVDRHDPHASLPASPKPARASKQRAKPKGPNKGRGARAGKKRLARAK